MGEGEARAGGAVEEGGAAQAGPLVLLTRVSHSDDGRAMVFGESEEALTNRKGPAQDREWLVKSSHGRRARQYHQTA